MTGSSLPSSPRGRVLNNPDAVMLSPRGGVVMCEDGESEDIDGRKAFVRGLTPDGRQKRTDLDPEAKAAVASEVRKRLDDESEDDAADEGETPEAQAKRMMEAGELDEDTISFALSEGKRGFVMAALALKSKIKPEIVDKILSARSAKGVMALAWKAGMGPRFGAQLQMRLGGISPKQVLAARGGDWPMSPEDMTWHLEFFGA